MLGAPFWLRSSEIRLLGAARVFALLVQLDWIVCLWQRVAVELERVYSSSPLEHRSRFGPAPVRLLDDPSKVLLLSYRQLQKLGASLGVVCTGKSDELRQRILEAHADNSKTLQAVYPLPWLHMRLWKHLASRKITQSTALKEYKVLPRMLAALPYEAVDNPHYKCAAPMKLFRLTDVLPVARCIWITDAPCHQLLKNFPRTLTIKCPVPAKRHYAALLAGLSTDPSGAEDVLRAT